MGSIDQVGLLGLILGTLDQSDPRLSIESRVLDPSEQVGEVVSNEVG